MWRDYEAIKMRRLLSKKPGYNYEKITEANEKGGGGGEEGGGKSNPLLGKDLRRDAVAKGRVLSSHLGLHSFIPYYCYMRVCYGVLYVCLVAS